MNNAKNTTLFPYLERLLEGEKVEWKTLGEVCKIKNGKDYKHLSNGSVPVYGSGGVMKYVNEAIYSQPSVLIPRKGSLNNLFFVDTPFWNVDTIYYTEINTDYILPKFFYYYLITLELEKLNLAGGVPSLTQSTLNKLSIPIPPLRVQARIVEILDKFTQLEAQLEAELQAELEARRKQYAYYRDQLLNFSQYPPLNVNIEWRTLGEVCDYIRGITYNKTAETTDSCGWKVLRANNITLETRTLNFDEVKRVKSATRIRENQMLYRGDILICAGSGSKDHIGKTAYIDHNMDCTFGGFMGVLRVTAENTVSSRFLFHYIGSSVFINYLKTTLKSSTINNLNAGIINPFPIPIPPLSEQRRIVDILDRFDTLTNSISEGLPKEIALRRKQYAYYRDALLSFPRPEVSA